MDRRQAKGRCGQAQRFPRTQPDHAEGEERVLLETEEQLVKQPSQGACKATIHSVPAERYGRDLQQDSGKKRHSCEQGPGIGRLPAQKSANERGCQHLRPSRETSSQGEKRDQEQQRRRINSDSREPELPPGDGQDPQRKQDLAPSTPVIFVAEGPGAQGKYQKTGLIEIQKASHPFS